MPYGNSKKKNGAVWNKMARQVSQEKGNMAEGDVKRGAPVKKRKISSEAGRLTEADKKRYKK